MLLNRDCKWGLVVLLFLLDKTSTSLKRYVYFSRTCSRHSVALALSELLLDFMDIQFEIDLMQIWRLLISINCISSKISNAAEFQSCRPNTREMVDINKIQRKYETMCGSQSTPCLTAIHLSLIFSFFEMSTIPHVFGLQL